MIRPADSESVKFCASNELSMKESPSMDNCPTCGRRIRDFDPAGCETESGQRYCLVHRDAGARLHGTSTANAVARRVSVYWEMDPDTRAVTANGRRVGQVVESLPGKLYYFQNDAEAAAGELWGAFPSLASAAEHGAVRAFL